MTIEKLPFEWTPDCGGKEDYDGDVLSIESRIYPRGGSESVLDRASGKWSLPGDPSRDHIRPWGGCRIRFLGVKVAELGANAETTEELKAIVEAWALQMVRVIEPAVLSAVAYADRLTRCGTCSGSGEIEVSQTRSAACIDCKGTGRRAPEVPADSSGSP